MFAKLAGIEIRLPVAPPLRGLNGLFADNFPLWRQDQCRPETAESKLDSGTGGATTTAGNGEEAAEMLNGYELPVHRRD